MEINLNSHEVNQAMETFVNNLGFSTKGKQVTVNFTKFNGLTTASVAVEEKNYKIAPDDSVKVASDGEHDEPEGDSHKQESIFPGG